MEKEIFNRNKKYNSKELERLAKRSGLEVISGNGRHGKHLVSKTTGRSWPLVDHGSRHGLSLGVMRSTLRFIEQEVLRQLVA